MKIIKMLQKHITSKRTTFVVFKTETYITCYLCLLFKMFLIFGTVYDWLHNEKFDLTAQIDWTLLYICISWLALSMLSLHTVELYRVHKILLFCLTMLTWLSYWTNTQNNYFSFGFTASFSHSFCHCCCSSHEVYSETCLYLPL